MLAHPELGQVLASCMPRADDAASFTEHYVFLGAQAPPLSALELESWLGQLPAPPMDAEGTVPLLPAPTFTPVDLATRSANLGRLLAELPDDAWEHCLSLLGAAIDKRSLAIVGFPADFKRRLRIVAGLQALLPGELAARLTYATQAPLKTLSKTMLAFSDELKAADAWRFDWAAPALFDDLPPHPWLEALRALWTDDADALAAAIQDLGRDLAISESQDLSSALASVAGRIGADGGLSSEVILAALDSQTRLSEATRRLYLEQLLRNALHERDREAGLRVAEELENEAELERALAPIIDEMLEDQPDSVYVFIRNRLMQLGVAEPWVERLGRAARDSLEVAIQDGDVGTLAGWLELIAHEPQAYRLHEALRDGILSARSRAYSDGELGIHLILIAARRVPEIVDSLYEDEKLIAALETKVRAALQNPTAAALERLIDEKAETFLLALYHGIQASEARLVTLASARRLWALQASEASVNLPAVYRPPAVTRLLATQATSQMSDEALDFLFDQIVQGDDRKLTLDAAQHLAERDMLFPRLSHALEGEGVSLDKVISIMNGVSGLSQASPRDVIDCYFTLLDYYQWEPATQRMMESLARAMASHQEAQISSRHLWKLFDSCRELKMEGATRVSSMRLLCQYGEAGELERVVEALARICRQIHWTQSTQEAVNNWWRGFTHSQSLAQLQRLERELEPQGRLEAQKGILHSAVAMRRWLQSLDPMEFAAAINTTFTILEHISEAFDVAHVAEIDSQTIRREVDEVGRQLSSEQRHILANNLRNLALKIPRMAEKRSKPSLIRSDDSIDRQLLHGEANPQGSIDMMKWIAGYLDGAHPYREG